MRFQIGDRVRVTKKVSDRAPAVGSEGTVVLTAALSACIHVQFEDWTDEDFDSFPFYQQEIEAI